MCSLIYVTREYQINLFIESSQKQLCVVVS